MLKKLVPSSFPWSKYDAGTIPASVLYSTKQTVNWLFDQNIIGYIPGMELEIRPRTDAVGILIDFNGFETWSHLDINAFEEYQRQFK